MKLKVNEERTMKSLKKIAKQYFKRSFSLPAANYKLASYHHDQCERSLRMHLFSLEKQDLTLVLTLFVSFGLLCIILSSIAPQASVFDTILISKSTMGDPPSEKSAPIVEQVEQNSIDMDLAPTSSFEQPKKEIFTKVSQDAGTKRRSQDKEEVDYSYETFVFTKPLNNLNRHIGLDLRARFGDISMPNGFPNLNKVSVSFKIAFIFETLDNDKRLKINATHLEGLPLEREISRANKTVSAHSEQRVPPTTMLPTNNGLRVFQQLNVTFDCEIREHSRLNRDKIDLTKTSINNSIGVCEVPDLSVQFKINHSKKSIYKITTKITDIKFNHSTMLTMNSGDDSLDDKLKLKTLELILLLSYTNSSFILLTIFIHLILLILSFSIACCFLICLSEYKFKLWSLEQKWTALLLILLVGSNSEYQRMSMSFSQYLAFMKLLTHSFIHP